VFPHIGWPSKLRFIPKLSVSVQWGKLGISWNWISVQKICWILFRLDFDWWRICATVQVQVRHKTKTGGETPLRTNLGEKTVFVSCLFRVYCFHPDFSFLYQFQVLYRELYCIYKTENTFLYQTKWRLTIGFVPSFTEVLELIPDIIIQCFFKKI
jgi:hypothetical protein